MPSVAASILRRETAKTNHLAASSMSAVATPKTCHGHEAAKAEELCGAVCSNSQSLQVFSPQGIAEMVLIFVILL